MVDITLKQLEVFRALVITGSLTNAGRRLRLSQPAVSAQIANLERALGISLFMRRRAETVSLTAAGEHWFKISDEMLRRLDQATSEHERDTAQGQVTIQFGIMPNLRNLMLASAARVALETPGFAKFDAQFALNSGELVEQVRLHTLNCVVVDEHALLGHSEAMVVAPLFRDPIVWLVPRSVSDAQLSQAMSTPKRQRLLPPEIYRHIEVDHPMPMHKISADWFREKLPASAPSFSVTQYTAAAELAVEGLGTAHVPLSVATNLGELQRNRVNVFPLPGIERKVVMAMPRHLMSLPSYSTFFTRLAAHYVAMFERLPHDVRELPDGDFEDNLSIA